MTLRAQGMADMVRRLEIVFDHQYFHEKVRYAPTPCSRAGLAVARVQKRPRTRAN
jgi:hypothetical protein